MRLAASNGCVVDACATAAPLLLAAGWQPDGQPGAEVDLTALTVAAFRAMCDERGVEAPKRATKAQLIELLN